MERRRHAWRGLAVAALLAGGAAPLAAHPQAGAAPSPSPSPSASPSPGPSRPLRIDVERHVERLLEERARRNLPRFETELEVVGKTPQVLIERFFGGADLECAPTGTGAPAPRELDEARPTPPPTADLLALAQVLAGKLQGKPAADEGRFFAYRVTRGPRAVYELRETKVPVAWLYGVGGARYELIEGYATRDDAVRGLRRLERGLAAPAARAVRGEPPSPCRPRR